MTRPRSLSPGRRLVLLYHSVHPELPFRSVSPTGFEHHLDWLVDNCDVVPLESLIDSCDDDAGKRPQIAITFDDGFEDNHRYAFPALTERSLPATFFVTTGLIDSTTKVRSRFAGLHDVSLADVIGMTWSQLEELNVAGMTVAAHTVTHPNLAICDGPTRTRELTESRSMIEERLQVPVTSVAYPFGKPKHNVTSDVIDTATKTGYDFGCSVNYLPLTPDDNRFAIPRYAVTGDDLDLLIAIVSGGWDALGRWQRFAPRWMSTTVSPNHSFRREQSLLPPR